MRNWDRYTLQKKMLNSRPEYLALRRERYRQRVAFLKAELEMLEGSESSSRTSYDDP